MLDHLRLDGIELARNAVVASGNHTAWSELIELARAQQSELVELRRQRVGLQFRASGLDLAMATALDRLECEVFLISGDLPAEEVQALAGGFGMAAVLNGEERTTTHGGEEAEYPGVVLLTSGTTGLPKAARHTWESLTRPVRTSDELRGANWLLCYRPQLYAGIQVLLQCLANRGTLIVPPPSATAAEVVLLGEQQRVEFVSATPSYWRRLITFGDLELLRRWPLKQITLGGEIVDQRILDQLASLFPAARLVHIYATTELGRCFSVTDSLSGFPSRFLDHVSPDGVEMKVVEGELWVRSANAMHAYDRRTKAAGPSEEGWFATGDQLELRGDRYHFIGRRTELINVGGNKVSPQHVEQVILSVPGVSETRVFAKSSSLVGQLVACEVVVTDGFDRDAVVEAVEQTCLKELASHERPRLVAVKPSIELSAAGKKVR